MSQQLIAKFYVRRCQNKLDSSKNGLPFVDTKAHILTIFVKLNSKVSLNLASFIDNGIKVMKNKYVKNISFWTNLMMQNKNK